MNQATDSSRIFALWLGALFLTTLGAHLWIAWLYGSPLPLWDQWFEASFFKSWVAGTLKWTDFFASHNEHRVLATRVLDIGLIWANGRWEPLLQMTVNAFLLVAYACALAFCLWNVFGRRNGWLVCFLLMPFFVLPFGGENATWGFNSQQYFVNLFGLAAIAGLGFCKPGSWPWWTGIVAAFLGLFTMANGLLAPLAAGGLIILRTLKKRQAEKSDLASLIASLGVFAVGAALTVTKQADHSFQAHSCLQFTTALTHDLSWPFYNAPVMPCFIGLPLALLLAFYLRPNFPQPRAAEFLLVLALWSLLQAVVLAFGRANYGGPIPSSRYMDWLDIFVIAAVFAAFLLAQLWEGHLIRNGILAFVFIGVIFAGLCRMSQIVVEDLLVPNRMMTLISEESVQRFLANGSASDFLERPSVPPDPPTTLKVLTDPQLQPILPLCCVAQSPAMKPERLMPFSNWLMEHSVAIMSGGLILFCGLCGFGLARGAPGLAARNPVGVLALLAGLAALGFVWSRHAVNRDSVEYALEERLAAEFQAAGNPRRAAIHAQDAQALKQFAN